MGSGLYKFYDSEQSKWGDSSLDTQFDLGLTIKRFRAKVIKEIYSNRIPLGCPDEKRENGGKIGI